MNQDNTASYSEVLRQINTVLDQGDPRWLDYLEPARELTKSLDATEFFDSTDNIDEQKKVINTLQRLAYYQSDTSPVTDLAEWCLQKWLHLLASPPNDLDVLHGLGRWWLSRAQPALARIHLIDGDSSGSSGDRPSRPNSGTDPAAHTSPQGSSDSERRAAAAVREADGRVHAADAVEARGYIWPAIHYLQRAIEVAGEREVAPSTSLLITTAEAYMSMGNVSSSRRQEGYFDQAIIHLRTVAQAHDGVLPSHLQRYLDDFGRFVD